MRLAYPMLMAAALAVHTLTFPATAAADEASDKVALARQVVDQAVAPGIDGRVARMIAEAAAKQPADRQAAFRADAEKAAAPIRADLLGEFATYYASALSLAELKDIHGFYSSPAGRKLVQVEEAKPAEVNAAIQQYIIKLVVLINGPK
ncbi:DUF2059 domain-containing protein [Xanthobacter wiegelii]|uniref:DUF2059 domain-containing protein n=1 Tax=Xanthobacter wiegelii TaxID=3119913 RepID=UPI0037272995